jgi:uncharacterized membrane-anchored protein YitT (DUF2179 family)
MPTRKARIKRRIIDLIFNIAGIISASIGLKALLLPNQFLDGGITGVSLLVNRLTNIDLSLLIFTLNIPFIILAYKQISLRFAIKSFISITVLAILIHFIKLPILTEDKVLIAFFGGLFLGVGIGFAVRSGSVIDGTEVLAIYLSKKIRISVGSVILIFNIVLFCTAALLFNLEIALYSILTYISASKAADYIIHGIEEYIGITIVSVKSEEIRKAITEEMGYGATIYRGKRGYRKVEYDDKDLNIIHTIITRLELNKIYKVINNIDEKAFVVEFPVNDVMGGIVKKKKITT